MQTFKIAPEKQLAAINLSAKTIEQWKTIFIHACFVMRIHVFFQWETDEQCGQYISWLKT